MAQDNDKSAGGAQSCVGEVMKTELATLTPDTGAAAALRLANTRQVTHFLVVDGGTLAGIVCDTDLKRAGRFKLVSDCMISPVLCVAPDATLSEAAGIMKENAITCLPVVTGAFLVGVITRDRLRSLDIKEITAALRTTGMQPSSLCVACGAARGIRHGWGTPVVFLCRSCGGMAPDGALPS